MNWFVIEPLDTLFFRGAEPMVMGSDHTATLVFPPHSETIAGALRTACILKANVDFRDYNKDKAPSELIEKIGKSGTPAPFTVVGPLFEEDGKLYIPAPYSWFAEKHALSKAKAQGVKVAVKKYQPNVGDIVLCNGKKPSHWVRSGRNDLTSLGGLWIAMDECTHDEVNVRETNSFFVRERRIGIALDEQRRVREGHLYSFVHARLKKNVRIVFAIDKDIGITETTHIQLGAEQRMALLKPISAIKLHSGQSKDYLALSLIEENGKAHEKIVATGKPIYLGGWDMHRRFHKPMKGYYPAGSVFSEKISENMIQL